jgi:hypothetical protein
MKTNLRKAAHDQNWMSLRIAGHISSHLAPIATVTLIVLSLLSYSLIGASR